MLRWPTWLAFSVLLGCSSGGGGEGADAAASDGGSSDASSADASSQECFPFSLDPDLPLAIDGVFTADSERWRRPHDEPPRCPATSLLPESAAEVPLQTVAFCNDDSAAHTFRFELISADGPNGEQPLDDPYLILYDGVGIPGDPLACRAINDDIEGAFLTKDSEITDVTVEPGRALTAVATTFTFDPDDGTGTGYYVLAVTATD